MLNRIPGNHSRSVVSLHCFVFTAAGGCDGCRKLFVIILGFALAITTGPAKPGAPITNQLTHPEIWDVHFAANGRDLAIRGAFAPGSIVLINGARVKTRQLSTDPTILVVKKGAKMIRHLETAAFAIQEPDGAVSQTFVPTSMNTLVTLEDNGAALNLKVGDEVLVLLGGSLSWRIYSLSYDQSILGVNHGPGMAIAGYIALLWAVTTGVTTLSIIGDPACSQTVPPCPDSPTTFTVSFSFT